MNLSSKLNSDLKFEEFYERIQLANTLKNAIQSLDFKHPTHCEEEVLKTIFPTEEQDQEQEKKITKKLKKARKVLEKLQQEQEDDDEEDEEIEEEDENEEVEEEQEEGEEGQKQEVQKLSKKQLKERKIKEQELDIKNIEKQIELRKDSKHFIIQSGYQTGKTTSLVVAQINDFLPKVQKFNPKQIQKDQDEATHGLFSTILCQSKEQCQIISSMAEHLLLKFKKKEKVKTSSGQELTQQDKQINSQISIYNLSTIPKGQNPNIMPSKHYILVGTPSQFLKFAQTMQIDKKYYVNFAVDDLDYMLSFGYEQDLDNFQFHFQHQIATSQLLITISSEFTKELQNILEKITLRGRQIDLNLAQELEEAAQDEQLKKTQQAFEREYRLVSQFYHLGDETSKYIILYILYKLHFLVGKTLIVCPDNDQVYKVFLFLQRINVKGFQVLNEEDPKDLRYYVLSMFNTGVVQNLITTEKVFDDLKSKTFYHKKRKVLSFKNLNNIINMDLSHVEKIYNNMYTHFKGSEGTIINLLSTDEQEIDVLTKLIEEQKQTQSQINIKEFPLKKNEIDAFKYRISDVIGAISRKQISNMRMLDFKRKMLKSSDLVQYFQQNESEKLMLVEHIQTLSQQIHRYGIKCEEDIPDYLVPDMVKEQRKKMGDVTNQKYQKLQVTTTNENFQQSLKRRMEGQGKSLDDIKKKRVIEKMDNDNFVYVNNKKENIEGDQVDPSQLKIISGRKLWKQRHGFKTKKRNRRLERKGIYNA